MADYKKPDFWTLKARKEGYPARSVYKLQEMDGKFGLLKNAGPADHILDLGAAPGSWSLYVLRKAAAKNGPAGLSLTSVDISPLSRRYDRGLFDGGAFCFIPGDITDPVIRGAVLSRGPYSLILSDAAPSTTGSRPVDAARSLELAETVLAYAGSALAKGGGLVLKVFQGGDSAGLLKRIGAMFTAAKSFKPRACRGESFETYYIGTGLKASGVIKDDTGM
jgi:23S rRNA (uridine2552-2'-O)-methyltransferase